MYPPIQHQIIGLVAIVLLVGIGFAIGWLACLVWQRNRKPKIGTMEPLFPKGEESGKIKAAGLAEGCAGQAQAPTPEYLGPK